MEIANFGSNGVISGQFDGFSNLARYCFVGSFVFAIIKGKMKKFVRLEVWEIFRVDLSWCELFSRFFKLGAGAGDA